LLTGGVSRLVGWRSLLAAEQKKQKFFFEKKNQKTFVRNEVCW